MPTELMERPATMPETVIADEAAPVPDFNLYAIDGESMARSQQSLRDWFIAKRELARRELKEAQENVETARHAKWKIAPFQSLAKKLEKQVMFYDKAISAVDAGYTLAPNFPGVDYIAIRTNKKNPRAHQNRNRFMDRSQSCDILPEGEGRYVDSRPKEFEDTYDVIDTKGETKTVTDFWAGEFEEFGFPIALAKPQVVAATEKAMALKVFDRIGLLPGRVARRDPIIVGEIVLRKLGRYQAPERLTFMIGWFVDLRTL